MEIKLVFPVLALVATTALGAIPGFDDNFDSYTEGRTFTVATNYGWQASSSAAYVTNSGGYASKALFMGESVALTNMLSADANLKIWTDFRLKPMLGVAVDNPQTNVSSLLYYFNTNGFMVLATTNGWRVYTNDIWGSPVVPVTTNDYARLSVFQDFNTSNQVLFLNDQLILQDFRFVGSVGHYNRFVIDNTNGNCWLDNVWVNTNVIGLASNRNGDAQIDADEIQYYGYARRTLYVCKTSTNLAPLYTTITNALVDWRPRDSIHVITGDYSGEAVALSANPSNVAFEGDAFTVASLTVASNASVSFAQAFSCGTLTVSGLVALAQSAALTSATANVVGNGLVTLASNSAFVVNGALTVLDSGRLDFATNSQFVASLAGVTMNGAFAISNTWGSSLVSMTLPFSDNFELYAANTVMTNLKFRGWNASTGTVVVTNGVSHSGTKSVVLPDGTVLSNSINTAASQKIWTDYYIRPTLGVEPSVPATNISSFLAYANTNGFLVVATAGGGWTICSNQLNGVEPTRFQSNVFTRVTVCQDLGVTPPKFAVFIASNLVAQGLSSPAGSLHSYSSFVTDNREGNAYVDDVRITTTIPPGLDSDLNGNGLADAYEINTYGLTSEFLDKGTIFKFR